MHSAGADVSLPRNVPWLLTYGGNGTLGLIEPDIARTWYWMKLPYLHFVENKRDKNVLTLQNDPEDTSGWAGDSGRIYHEK